MRRLLVQLILVLAVATVACQHIVPKENSSNTSLFVRTATIEIASQDDFCGQNTVLRLNDGRYIIPTNLELFMEEPVNNQVVHITYREAENPAFLCSNVQSVSLSHLDIPNAMTIK